MSLPLDISRWLKAQASQSIDCIEFLSKSASQSIARITLSDRRALLLKFTEKSGLRSFAVEAEGLLAINAQVDGFAAEVLAYSDDALLLPFYERSTMNKQRWQQLGEELAQLHHRHFEHFGFERDNYCGESVQKNSLCDDGHRFFIQNRLQYQIDMAYQNHRLDQNLYQRLIEMSHRLEEWIPTMPSVLIHGDLWSGNVLATPYGPRLIDPACYYGWAEAELAMTTLFGGFDRVFYQSYAHHGQLSADWKERIPLYNLYHQLNHLNIFGISYLPSIQAVVKLFK